MSRLRSGLPRPGLTSDEKSPRILSSLQGPLLIGADQEPAAFAGAALRLERLAESLDAAGRRRPDIRDGGRAERFRPDAAPRRRQRDLGGRRGAAGEVGAARCATYPNMQRRKGPTMRRREGAVAAVCPWSGLPAARPRHSRWRPSGPTGRGHPPPPRAARSSPAHAQRRPTAEGYVLPANPALATGSVTARASTPPGSIRCPELIDLAESSNPATRIAWNDARRAALAAGIAESAFLPNITATAIGGYQGSSGHQTALGTELQQQPFAGWHGLGACPCNGCCSTSAQRAAVVDAAKQGSVISNIAFTAVHQQLIYGVTPCLL